MPRIAKPACMKQGHKLSKEQLAQLDNLEREMLSETKLVFETPDYLDDYANIYYKYLIDNLKESKIPICDLDKPLIEHTATCLSIIHRCDLALKVEDLVIDKVDKYGNVQRIANPYLKIRKESKAEFNQSASRLGLEPSSRSAIASAQIQNVSEQSTPLMQILNGLNK